MKIFRAQGLRGLSKADGQTCKKNDGWVSHERLIPVAHRTSNSEVKNVPCSNRSVLDTRNMDWDEACKESHMCTFDR
eukprot:977146-Pelagomonas_calceolata.AAC.3